MARLFSRETFHNLVWSLPLAELAERLQVPAYRISDLCRWRVIPIPGDPQCARLAAGEPSSRTPLRPPGKGITNIVDINCRIQPRSTYARYGITQLECRSAS